MENIQLHRRYSLSILLRLIIAAAVVAAILLWKKDFILDVYFRNQLTSTGYIINGSIVALFALGMIRLLTLLFSYAREESALYRYMENIGTNELDALTKVPANSIIARRHRTMERLAKVNTPINHGALASTLVASLSTRTSLLKFIHNILILTGVFGTIVSLSIALMGASDMLESAVGATGMGMVVHGMSTALSTTITAIVCYLLFGYFYTKLADIQTNLLSGVEQVTTTYLMPRYQVQPDNVLYEFAGLIRSLQALVNQMKKSQDTFEDVEKRIGAGVDESRARMQALADQMSSIQSVLRDGFRLPPKG